MNKRKGHSRISGEDRTDLAGEYRWGDTGQMLLAFIFMIGMLIDIFYLKTPFPFGKYFSIYIQLLIAVPLLILAGYLAKSGLDIVFGEQREQLEVINTGVFSVVRHPVYLGSILLFFSFMILSLSAVAFLIWIVIMLFYIYLAWYEEQLLLDKLGKSYQQYKKNVPMFIPKIIRRKL